MLLMLAIFISGSMGWAACPSPFAAAAAEHFWFKDRDLFRLYNSEVRDIKKSTLNDQRALSQELQRRNSAALADLFAVQLHFNPFEGPLPSKSQAQKILTSLRSHPVVGDEAQMKYDATSAETGFCFGRAAYVHFELLRLGVKPSSIMKVFVMGGLYREGTGWDYHVATAVRGAEGLWWVIDSLVDTVMPLQRWMQEVSRWDGNRVHPRIRFYFTDATKFQPVFGTYDPARLSMPIYNGYFRSLSSWYAKHSCQKQ